MKRLFGFCFALAFSCGLSGAPTSTAQTSGAFSIQMPLKLADADTNTFGLNPFGGKYKPVFDKRAPQGGFCALEYHLEWGENRSS